MTIDHAKEMYDQGFERNACMARGLDISTEGLADEELYLANADWREPGFFDWFGGMVAERYGRYEPMMVEAGGESMVFFEELPMEEFHTGNLQEWSDILEFAHENNLPILFETRDGSGNHVEALYRQPSGEWIMPAVYLPYLDRETFRTESDFKEFLEAGLPSYTAEQLFDEQAHIDEEGYRCALLFPPQPTE